MAKTSVPKEVLLDGAQMCLAATTVGIIGFLKERNIPVKALVDYMGEQFEDSLGDLEGEEVGKVMEHLLTLEVLPMGAEVISSQATAGKAEVTLTSLPPRKVLEKFGTTPGDLLQGFGVTMMEYASIYGMYAPAARAIGLRFRHQLKGGKEILSLERR
jgi:hypothetical protein